LVYVYEEIEGVSREDEAGLFETFEKLFSVGMHVRCRPLSIESNNEFIFVYYYDGST